MRATNTPTSRRAMGVGWAFGMLAAAAAAQEPSVADLTVDGRPGTRCLVVDEGWGLTVLASPTSALRTFRDGNEHKARCKGFDGRFGWALVELTEPTPRSAAVRAPTSPETSTTLHALTPSGTPTPIDVRSAPLWVAPERAKLGFRLEFGSSTSIATIAPGSPAEHAGLKIGDRLVSVDGRPVTGRSDVMRALLEKRGGDLVVVKLESPEGQTTEASLVLDFLSSDGDDPEAMKTFLHAMPEEGLPPGTPLRTADGRVAGVHWARTSTGDGLALDVTEVDRLVAWLRAERAYTPPEPVDVGQVTVKDDRAQPGYTMYSTFNSNDIALVDLDGQPVRRWTFDRSPWSCYMLENGDVMAAIVDDTPATFTGGGGVCGRIVRQSYDGDVLWDYRIASDDMLLHHDIEPLPNGHVLGLVWRTKTKDEAVAAGRDPGFVGDAGIWALSVCEIEPVGTNGGRVVWEWSVWDHLIQDFDETKPHFGDPASHPGRIDLNGSERRLGAEERARLEALGYIAPAPQGRPAGFQTGDWTHMNAIDYHPELDQILLSARHWSELWIIDHSTTTEEAATNRGGRSGQGGDLLYRWGNPEKYRRGGETERQLYGQHDARWIEPGHPGSGNILVFNNGEGARNYSSVDELEPPLDSDGTYFIDEFEAFEPTEPSWSYSDQEGGFSSGFISGAHRLSNGNTLICSGAQHRIFEVTRDGDVVWDYQITPAGFGRGPGFGGPGFGGAGFGGPGQGAPPPGGFGGPDAFGGGGPPPRGGGVPGPPGIFRATRIPLEHPGVKGRSLSPLELD